MRYAALAGLIFALAGCAGGGSSTSAGGDCAAAGHKPGTSGYEACRERAAADQAATTRKAANSIPLDGYGPPMGRF